MLENAFSRSHQPYLRMLRPRCRPYSNGHRNQQEPSQALQTYSRKTCPPHLLRDQIDEPCLHPRAHSEVPPYTSFLPSRTLGLWPEGPRPTTCHERVVTLYFQMRGAWHHPDKSSTGSLSRGVWQWQAPSSLQCEAYPPEMLAGQKCRPTNLWLSETL